MSRGAAVQLEGLSKHYGDLSALRDVGLAIEPGRFLVLLGPSGSGKSTLIRCLAGIERPSAGTIHLGGEVVSGARRHVASEHRDLAMVFQDFALWPHMSVLENVQFALRRRRLSRQESHARAVAMIDRVGLAAKCARYPHELSGGEQQRVALARALVGEPSLLLFDEPLSSLDAGLRERLRIEIGALVRECGASAVYITHDQGEAFALGDEVGVLQAGRLIQIGTPESIYRSPAAAFVARFTGLAGELAGRMLGPAAVADGVRGASTHAPASCVKIALPTVEPGRHLSVEATAMAELRAGAAVHVLIRPTAVRVCDPLDGAASLAGIVKDVAFCGRGYEYAIEIGSSLQLTGVFDHRRLARGHRCGIALASDGCLAFPEDAAEQRPGPLPLEALPGIAPARTTASGNGSRVLGRPAR